MIKNTVVAHVITYNLLDLKKFFVYFLFQPYYMCHFSLVACLSARMLLDACSYCSIFGEPSEDQAKISN